MMTGFVDIDGNSYYFSAKQNGAMVKSRTVTINKVTYNFDANGMATPVISKTGSMQKGQAIVDYALQFVTTKKTKAPTAMSMAAVEWRTLPLYPSLFRFHQRCDGTLWHHHSPYSC